MRAGLLFLGLLVGLALGPAPASACLVDPDAACTTRSGEYRIRVPDGPGPHPAVVYLYGSLGESAQKIAQQGFVQAFVERGYAVIVPEALQLQYRNGVGTGWHLRHEGGRKQRDDAAFVREVLEDAAVEHGVDRRRVMIAGMSRGGFLAWEIACHDPGLALAYAPVAAGYLGDMPDRCEGPVRMLHTHGRTDTVVPLNPEAAWRSGGTSMMPLDAALERLAATSGCIGRKQPERFREYDRTSWQDCVQSSSIDLFLHNGGHSIPLSWYSSIVDWFETGTLPTTPRVVSGGGTAVFRSVGERSGTRFKKVAPSD